MLLFSFFTVLLLLIEESNAYYAKSTGSTCGDITTASECYSAATALGFSYQGSGNYGDSYPEGCFTTAGYIYGYYAYFNTRSSSTNIYCSSTYKCVCGTSNTDYFQYNSGSCTLSTTGECFYSPNYPAAYDSSDSCSFTVLTSAYLDVLYFNLESIYDLLYVDGISYSGSSGPDNVYVSTGDSITFTSDANTEYQGFYICATQPTPPPTHAPTHAPTHVPTPLLPYVSTSYSDSQSSDVNAGMVVGIVFGSIVVVVVVIAMLIQNQTSQDLDVEESKMKGETMCIIYFYLCCFP
jgi:hypothetical protein